MRCRLTYGIHRFAALVILLAACAGRVHALNIEEGREAPNFTLKSDSGENLKLSEYRGDVVIVSFWASWCNACRQLLPALNQLFEKYREQRLTAFLINIDSRQRKARSLSRKLKLTAPVLFDADKAVSKTYGIDDLPTTVLIDRDGRVRYIYPRYRPGDSQMYEQHLQPLLAE